ncbi:hypothetical protein D6789_02285 [Candidatus Woesearchaeota archaeon]|nr:MAG: hypothetical protein D6789_02285 [Candidatus Woesearchaeota archaeon]
MVVSTLVGALEFSKVLIAFFIAMYAYYFLRESQHIEERRPWEFLFIASIMLFLSQLLANLQFLAPTLSGSGVEDVRRFLEFLFYGFFLFGFIYQHNLIHKQHLLVITSAPRKSWFDKLMFGKDLEPRDRPRDDRTRKSKEIDEELEELEKENDELPTSTELQFKDDPAEEEKLRTPVVEEEPAQAPVPPAPSLTPEQQRLKKLAQGIIDETEALLLNHVERIPPEKHDLIRAQLSELKTALLSDPFDEGAVKAALKALTASN